MLNKAPSELWIKNGEEFEKKKTKDYCLETAKKLKLKKAKIGDGEEEYEPNRLISAILDLQASSMSMPDELSSYQKAWDQVAKDFSAHKKHAATLKKNKDAAAAQKKADKEKAEEQKKAAKEKSEQLQVVVNKNVTKGVSKADAEFEKSIVNLKTAIPKSIEVVAAGKGYGLKFGAATKKEEVGTLIGYLAATNDNTTALQGQVNFFLGDLINEGVLAGIYVSTIEASKAISKFLAETNNRDFKPRYLEQVARQAARTPFEMRNAKVMDTVYLELANVKRPTKGKEETEEAFTARKESFDKDLKKIYKDVAAGKITRRKDILAPVDEFKTKHGLKKAKDPDDNGFTKNDWLDQYFNADFGIRKLVGKHEEGVAIYEKGDNVYKLTKEQLVELRNEAQGHLTNLKFKDKAKEIIAGKHVEVKQVVTGKKGGKNITEDKTVETPVYAPVWFAVEEPEDPETTDEEGGDEEE